MSKTYKSQQPVLVSNSNSNSSNSNSSNNNNSNNNNNSSSNNNINNGNSIINNNNGNLYLNVNNNGSGVNLNQLAPMANPGQLLTHRKSVIGRLERPSFQAQRLSDVGVAVGQQITAKMGLKLPASQERIVEQTRWLFLRYIFAKLRQNSLPLRDLNLTKSSRARRAAALGFEIPIISSSAPATADIQAPASSICGGQLGRKRTTRSGNIDQHDLTLLASRISISHLRNEDLVNESTRSPLPPQALKGVYQFIAPIFSNGNRNSNSIINGSSSDSSNSACATATSPTSMNTRKYIMDITINNQIFTVIIRIIRELRDIKSEYYSDTIYELIGIDKFSSLQSLLDVQMIICQEMTRNQISWCRIVALFSIFGAMSLDCVRMGTPEHVGPLLDGFIEFVERDLALWMSQQGGWESFLYKYRPGYHFRNLTSKLVAISLPFLVWIILTVFKWDI